MLIKNQAEINKIKEGGKIIGEILSKLAAMVEPGISTAFLDNEAERLIIKAGGKPAFKDYTTNSYDPPFPCTICASINQGVVHGIARPDMILKTGDNISIDIGMEYPVGGDDKVAFGRNRGWFTDTAITVAVGEIDPKVRELMRVTRESLEVGIKAVKPGKSVAEIGKAIEKYVNSQGKYGIIRDLVGHGVGHEVHEPPMVPNFYEKRMEHVILKPGMVIAIEPMVSLGDHRVIEADDGWAIETADGSMCAHYEHTVVVTKTGVEVLTRRPNEKQEKF